MSETAEGERAGALGEPRIHDLDFLTRLIYDADRLARAEELLQEIRDVEGDALLQGTADDIDAFLSGVSDEN